MIRVVKVGGSLLDFPELPQRLRAWVSRQTTAHNILIAGGGAPADQVRHRHAAGAIDETAAHWMCIDLLDVTAQLLQSRLPELPLVQENRLPPDRVVEPGATVFSPTAWLRRVEPGLPGMRLPCTWETTSDAIAGRLSVALRADELILLKSAAPRRKEGSDLAALADEGYIDPVLARMAAELPPLRSVNLRTNPATEFRILQFE